MSDMQIQQVLAQMRALSARAGADVAGAGAAAGNTEAAKANGVDFSRVLKQSLEQVNAAQQQASDMTTRFTAGAADVSLPDVVVATQKASLQFEAVTQVRNRLVAAYQEIMNMPV